MLFLTLTYPPSRKPRAIQISRIVQHLKDLDVTILASPDNKEGDAMIAPSHAPVLRVEPSPFTRFFQTCKGSRVKRALFPDLYYFWAKDLYRLAKRHIKNHTLLITFGMPMSIHSVGLRLKKENPNLKWIAHFSDPWIENPYWNMNFWTKFWNQKNQDQVFKMADKLIFTSTETVALCTQFYPKHIQDKTDFIPHSFDEKLFPKRQRQDDGMVLVRHIGEFYGPRQPTPFLKAMQYLKETYQFPKNLKIEFIGAKAPDGFNDPDIHFLPPVSYHESLQKMVDADLLLLIDADIENSPFFLSKLVDYMGARRPVFGVAPPGTCFNMLSDLGYHVAHPQNIKEIANYFLKSIASPFDLQEEKIAHYESKHVAKIFKSVMFEGK